jgi:hypothetical protein
MRGLRLLLFFIPVAIAAELFHFDSLIVFAASALGFYFLPEIV